MSEELIQFAGWVVIAMIWATVIVGGWSTYKQLRQRPKSSRLRRMHAPVGTWQTS